MTSDRRPLVAWWRRYFGKPPTFHFTFAHYAAVINRTSIEAEQVKERERQREAIRRWENGL